MDERQEQPAGTTGQLKRRGLIAGAAALAAAGLARLAGDQRAEAAHDSVTAYTPDNTMHVDVNNTTASKTSITRSGSANVAALDVDNVANGGP